MNACPAARVVSSSYLHDKPLGEHEVFYTVSPDPREPPFVVDASGKTYTPLPLPRRCARPLEPGRYSRTPCAEGWFDLYSSPHRNSWRWHSPETWRAHEFLEKFPEGNLLVTRTAFDLLTINGDSERLPFGLPVRESGDPRLGDWVRALRLLILERLDALIPEKAWFIPGRVGEDHGRKQWLFPGGETRRSILIAPIQRPMGYREETLPADQGVWVLWQANRIGENALHPHLVAIMPEGTGLYVGETEYFYDGRKLITTP